MMKHQDRHASESNTYPEDKRQQVRMEELFRPEESAHDAKNQGGPPDLQRPSPEAL
jgi:hypothetical protein